MHLYMYIIDRNDKRVHHPKLVESRDYGRRDFPVEVQGSISRSHFNIELFENGYFLKDLKSKNGTTHNGNRVGLVPKRFHKENLLRFGGVYVLFSDYALYTEVEILVKVGLVKNPIPLVDRTGISLINYAY